MLRLSFLLYVFILLELTLQAQDTLELTPLSVQLDDVVVTAQYAPTDVRNATHNVTVIQQKEWREQGLVTLSELLQRQLTLNVTPDPILGNGLSIQGLGGQNVQIMIDGVPVVGRLGGNVDLTQLDLSRFVRVEIVAGALSARYGTNAAGGVINLITAKEQAGRAHFEVGGQYESVDLDRQFARAGYRLGDFQISGGVQRYRARFAPLANLRAGTLPWNPKDQYGYDATVRYRPSDSLDLSYSYRNFAERVGMYGEVRRPRFRPYAQDQFFDTYREDHALSGTYRISPDWSLDLTAGHNTFERFRTSERRDLDPDTTGLVAGEQDTTEYTGTLVRTSLVYGGPGKISAQIGLEYLRETGTGGRILDEESADGRAVLTNAATWIGVNYDVLPRWTLEATTRVGYNSRYRHPIVPALHLLFKPNHRTRVRAGYARGFRAPAVQELFFNFIDVNHFIVGNTELNAERSWNGRLSVDWDGTTRLPVQLSGELFYNRIRDRITLADVDDGRFSYVNLSDYGTHGLTLRGTYSPSPALTMTAGGALTRLQNNLANSEEGSELPGFRNLYEWRNELAFTPPGTGFSFRLDHRYVGRMDRYAFEADGSITQGFIGDYHLLHLTTNKRFWEDRLTLNVGVKNLLNRSRVPVTGGSGGGAHAGGGGGQLIDFGRSAFVGVVWRWE